MKVINIEINIAEEKWLQELPTAETVIKNACIAALHSTGITEYTNNIEISVMLTDDIFIKQLNTEYRNKNTATNVLSFPLEEFIPGQYSGICNDIAIGDIVFALGTIQNEALGQHKSVSDHLAHLAVHGTLHLIGYDHEDEGDAAMMELLETKILAGLGIADPYATI